jgi:hypothetical protein
VLREYMKIVSLSALEYNSGVGRLIFCSCDHAQTDEQLKHNSTLHRRGKGGADVVEKSTLGKGVCTKAKFRASFFQFYVPK